MATPKESKCFLDRQNHQLCLQHWIRKYREKAAAEGLLSALRKKGKSKITSKRPEARPYIGDVRDSYKQMKSELYNYWQMICNTDGLDHLRVTEDVWTKSIFINQRFSGKGADAKLYFKFLDPTKKAYTLEYSYME